MDAKYRKILKLTTLIATTVLIATVSAATYSYMYIDGSISIGTSQMIWVAGSETSASVSIAGSTATVTLSVENGTHKEMFEALYLQNQNASGSYNILISIPTATSSSDFDTCDLNVYTNASGSWVLVDTITMTNSADTVSTSLAAGNRLRFSFDILAKPDASGSKAFDIQVRYD
jgi:hypothetical protein